MLLMPSQSLKNFLWPSSSKHNFTVPLKKHTSYCFWTIAPPNSYFSYFCKCAKCAKCAKMPKDRTKLKTKARYKISTINLLSNLCKKLLYKIHFSRNCKVGNLLIRSLLFRSKSLTLKSDHEQFAHITLYKRAMWMICLCFKQIARKERAIRSKNSYFFYVFDSFSSFLCPRANPSCRFLLICSFFKSDLSNSFPLLFTKEQPWAIRSGCSWQKSDRERFSQVAHDKRAREAIRSFPWANHSFAVLLKKQANCSKKPMSEFPTLQNWHFFMFSQMVKTQLSLSQNNFLVIGTHLTVA